VSSPPPAFDDDRLTLLLQSTGEGIFGVDMAGNCTFVNRAAADMLGYSTEMVLGRNMHELMHHSHRDGRHYPEAECPIYNAFRRGHSCRIDDEVLWRADGTHFPAEYSSHPLIKDGQVQGAVATFVDITARKAAEAALRRTNDELEARVATRTRELRELSNHLEAVREAERQRIAREIHDELGSLLVALKLDTQWLDKRLQQQPELRCKCHSMGRMIDTAVDNVGRIITDLRPSILDHQGLWAALEWQAQEFIESSELEANLQLHVAAGVAAPTGGQAIAVFRIFQEMLSNVARHAQARKVDMKLTADGPPDATLYLEVRDDGVGAAAQALGDPRSWGVMGMRERASQFGGRLQIDSTPGHGTRVRLVMPLQPPANGAAP
jgi:PAS domain S-box-containing protein